MTQIRGQLGRAGLLKGAAAAGLAIGIGGFTRAAAQTLRPLLRL